MVNGNVSRAAKTSMATTARGNKVLVTDFNIAVNDNANEEEIVTYYKVTLWGQYGANIAPYLTVGKEVNVSGIPGQEKPWTGEDGMTRPGSLTIRWARVELKGKKKTAADSEDVFVGQEIEDK